MNTDEVRAAVRTLDRSFGFRDLNTQPEARVAPAAASGVARRYRGHSRALLCGKARTVCEQPTEFGVCIAAFPAAWHSIFGGFASSQMQDYHLAGLAYRTVCLYIIYKGDMAV